MLLSLTAAGYNVDETSVYAAIALMVAEWGRKLRPLYRDRNTIATLVLLYVKRPSELFGFDMDAPKRVKKLCRILIEKSAPSLLHVIENGHDTGFDTPIIMGEIDVQAGIDTFYATWCLSDIVTIEETFCFSFRIGGLACNILSAILHSCSHVQRCSCG